MKNPEECKWMIRTVDGEPICILEDDFCRNARFCQQEIQEKQKEVDCSWK